jgi:hypothetical protein
MLALYQGQSFTEDSPLLRATILIFVGSWSSPQGCSMYRYKAYVFFPLTAPKIHSFVFRMYHHIYSKCTRSAWFDRVLNLSKHTNRAVSLSWLVSLSNHGTGAMY